MEPIVTEIPRETRVLDAVVSLVDSLLDDYDVVDLLTELTSARSCWMSRRRDCCSPPRAAVCN